MRLFLSVFFACTDTKSTGFNAYGETTVTSPVGSSNNSTDSTNATDTEDDTGEDSGESAGQAPVITDLVAFFSNSADEAPSLEVHISADDPDGDILNGNISGTLTSEEGSVELNIPIDGNDAIMDMGDIVFVLLENINNEIEYSLSLTVTDEAGNTSLPQTENIYP